MKLRIRKSNDNYVLYDADRNDFILFMSQKLGIVRKVKEDIEGKTSNRTYESR